jgi:quinol monooxygenase YgiN
VQQHSRAAANNLTNGSSLRRTVIGLLRELRCRLPRSRTPRKRKQKIMITLINVFTVEPLNQQRLVDLLARATDEFVTQAPGFVSSTLHRSLDGTKVTMYAQWSSVEDYETMRRDPGPLPLFQEALSIATFEPGMYEIVRTFSPTHG